MGANTSRMPAVHASACQMLDEDHRAVWTPCPLGAVPSMSWRAASMTWLTGWWTANACSQPGMDWTLTKADEAKVKGNRMGKAANCAASLLEAVSPMMAKVQLKA